MRLERVPCEAEMGLACPEEGFVGVSCGERALPGGANQSRYPVPVLNANGVPREHDPDSIPSSPQGSRNPTRREPRVQAPMVTKFRAGLVLSLALL